MNWDDLRYFLAVADAQSLQGASRKLGVNHSTAFRRIRRLEDAIETRLFERLADGYHLTQAGEELLTHARRAGDEIDLLQLKVLGKDYQPRGTIRLTAPDRIAYEYLPKCLAAFTDCYPEIDLELDVGAENLDLTRREADIAVRATSQPPEHLIGRKVTSVPWSYFASRPYLKTAGRPKQQEDLSQHMLIGADGALRRLPAFRHLESRFGDKARIRCSTLNGMAAMAMAGMGVALMPNDQSRPTLVRLFQCTPDVYSTLWLLTHPELRRTERIRLLMDHLYRSLRADPRLGASPSP